jgi:predicted nucleic acid-binding protein
VTGIVLDASMALSWCFEDEWTSESDRVLELVRANGALVPPLWDLEVANVLVVAERRGRVSRADTERLLSLLEQLPIELADGDPGVRDVTAAARDFGLTAYDACYLVIAMRTDRPLATLDAGLAAAASQAGVALA